MRPTPPPFRRLVPSVSVVAGVLMLALAGCGEQEAIRHYTVPKTAGAKAEPPRSGSTDRTLAAMVPQGERTWFFKMIGPNEAVAAEKDDFLALVKSVHFNDESEPTWTLPDGWERTDGSQFRYATLKLTSGETPLEVSVIPLPTAIPDPREFILQNVNRWRNELGLRNVTTEELFDGEPPGGGLTQFEQDGRTVTVVDLVGLRGPDDMRRPPFAGGMPPAAAQPAAESATDVTFTVPDGWTKAENDPFSRHAFTVESDGQQGRVTVTAAGGDLLDNANRWRRQLGLAPWSADEVQQHTQTVTVDGTEGLLVHFTEAGDDPQRKGLLGAIVPHGDRLWFFKLTGPAPLTQRERPHFETFLKSVHFESP